MCLCTVSDLYKNFYVCSKLFLFMRIINITIRINYFDMVVATGCIYICGGVGFVCYMRVNVC